MTNKKRAQLFAEIVGALKFARPRKFQLTPIIVVKNQYLVIKYFVSLPNGYVKIVQNIRLSIFFPIKYFMSSRNGMVFVLYRLHF